MAKVAVLVPNQEMSTIAKSLTGEFPSISLMAIESIQTDQAVRRAGELEQQGCDLIVARGVQARAIKRSVKLPLVEISVSQQELASVVLELKEELGLPCPRIGLIGLSNMFSDTSQFDRLFGIDLNLYMVEQNDELAAAAVRAFSDGCNAVIGGDIVCENARREKLPYKFIPSGVESLRNALTVAARVAYAIDLEKRNSAEINALLNYTFSGIVQVDREGIIRRVNRISYNLLEHPADTLLGRPISEILPNLNQNVLDNALIGGAGGLRLRAGHQPQGGGGQHRPHSGGQPDRGRRPDVSGRPAPDRNGQRDAPGAVSAGLRGPVQLREYDL